jgi:uncharacterized protein affecting Mg2+/Co2+ transport
MPKSRIPHSHTQVAAERRVYAGAVEAIPRFSFYEASGERIYVWSYKMTIFNAGPHTIKVVGRRLVIDEGSLARPVSGRQGFAPSVGGDQPILASNGSFTYEAGVATSAEAPSGITCFFQVSDCETNETFIISAPRFAFVNRGPGFLKLPAISLNSKLREEDAISLCKAVHDYNEACIKGSASFRADHLILSPDGRKLINCYLNSQGKGDPTKKGIFDLSAIMPKGYNCEPIHADDHYMLKSEQWLEDERSAQDVYFNVILVYNCPVLPPRKSSGDAALVHKFSTLVDKLGFDVVADLIVGRASPGERAHLQGMLACEVTKDTAFLSGKESTPPKTVTAAKKPKAFELPILPEGLSWPTEKFGTSPEARSRDGIIRFLERVWRPLIEAGYAERRIVVKIDPTVTSGISTYERSRFGSRRIPAHLRFLTVSEAKALRAHGKIERRITPGPS